MCLVIIHDRYILCWSALSHAGSTQQAILLINDLVLQMQPMSRPQAWGRAFATQFFWEVLVEVQGPMGSFTYGASWEIAHQALGSSRGGEGRDSGNLDELHVECSSSRERNGKVRQMRKGKRRKQRETKLHRPRLLNWVARARFVQGPGYCDTSVTYLFYVSYTVQTPFLQTPFPVLPQIWLGLSNHNLCRVRVHSIGPGRV
jgi:hypothetical protein